MSIRTKDMATIGTFTKTETGFTGTIKTFQLKTKATLVAADGGSDTSPDYRNYGDNVEFGADETYPRISSRSTNLSMAMRI